MGRFKRRVYRSEEAVKCKDSEGQELSTVEVSKTRLETEGGLEPYHLGLEVQ